MIEMSDLLLTNNITNNATLLIKIMGRLFEVTHIIGGDDAVDESNRIMESDDSVGMIAEDKLGRIYLAKIEEYEKRKA